MSICRHVLLRAYIPRLLSSPHAARRLLTGPVSLSLRQIPRPVAAATQPTSVITYGAETVEKSVPVSDTSTDNPVTQKASSGRPSNRGIAGLPKSGPSAMPAEGATEVQTENGQSDNTPQHRARSPLFRDYPLSYVMQKVDKIAQEGPADVVPSLVREYIRTSRYLGRPADSYVGEKIIMFAKQKLIENADLVILFEHMQKTRALSPLSVDSKVSIASEMLRLPPDPVAYPAILDATTSMLLPALVDPQVTYKRAALARNKLIVQMLHRLAVTLTKYQNIKTALNIMNILMKTHNIDPSVFRPQDLASRNFSFVVLSALVRSSLQSDWGMNAAQMWTSALALMEVIEPKFGELAVLVVRALAYEPSADDLQAATTIITLIMERSPGFRLPDAALQEFYDAAEHANEPELVRTVYQASLSARSLHNHTHSPPRGRVLTWFLHYLVAKRKDVHTARQLVAQVVSDEIPIPLQDRARFISLAAENGLATQARALWEHYAEAADSQAVVGNSTAMLRLVSLFASLHKRNQRAAARAASPSHPGLAGGDVVDQAAELAGHIDENSIPGVEPRSLKSARADRISADIASAEYVHEQHQRALESTSTSPAREPPSRGPATTEPTLGMYGASSHGGHAADNSTLAARSSENGIARISNPDVWMGRHADGAGLDTSTVTDTLVGLGGDKDADTTTSEYLVFAERVYTKFRASRHPLDKAHHYELNALARASFILGKLREGLAAFRTMIDRRLVPDIRDMNVALSVLARYNPTAAARVIDRMISLGLQPDEVTFGMVIHEAFARHDAALATALMQRAWDVNCRALSHKTAGMLVRAARTLRDGGVAPAERLARVRRLVDGLRARGEVPSANMGVDCVVVALRAGDAGAAFWFWERFVKNSTQWDDAAQARLRRAIVETVRTRVRQRGTARAMLAALGEACA